MSVKIRKEWFEGGGVAKQQPYVSGGGIGMNLKEKVIKCLGYCSDPHGDDCYRCLYYDKEWDSCNGPDLANDIMTLIKAYDFAWGQFKSTLEELIENNDGDVKEICVFLLNLLKVKEADIEKGFYI